MPTLRSPDAPPDEPTAAEPALCALLQTLRVDPAAVALSPAGLDVALAQLAGLDRDCCTDAADAVAPPYCADQLPARPLAPGPDDADRPPTGDRAVLHRPRFAAAAVAAVLLAGCANLGDAVDDILGNGSREPRTVSYECDDDRDFVARYSADREEVQVRAGDDTHELRLAERDGRQRVYSESGDEDDDDDVRLIATDGGREARLRIPNGSDFRDCEAEL